MASIRQRAGTWQARVTRKGYPNEVKSFSTRSDAARWSREVELAMDQGSYRRRASADQLLLSEILERYRAEVTPTKRGATDEAIRIRALQRDKVSSYALETLTPAVVALFRDRRLRGVRAGAVIRDLSLLSSVINHARREWGATCLNPCALVKKPSSPPGRSRLLTSGEEARLLTELSPIGRRNVLMKPLVVLALETAMRRGELLSLTWSNIDLDGQVAVLPMTKNGSSRTVPLSLKATALLSSMPKLHERNVFPITPMAVHAAFRHACQRADIQDLRFHDLRHCAATRMAEKLPNVIELAAVTGHRTVQMLKRYYHPSPQALAIKLG